MFEASVIPPFARRAGGCSCESLRVTHLRRRIPRPTTNTEPAGACTTNENGPTARWGRSRFAVACRAAQAFRYTIL
jgi:hypothetical protein